MITVTRRAAEMLRAIIDANPDMAGFGVRIGVRLGGCAGLNLAIEFTGEPEEGDIAASTHGVTTYVSPAAVPHLEGVVLDFDPSPDGAGFTFFQQKQPAHDLGAAEEGEAFEV